MKSEKKITGLLGSFFLILLLFSCGSGRTNGEAAREMEEIKELVSDRRFEIEHRWADPLRGGGRINLIGNPNFIRFKGDSVDIFLPYFGVRQMGGGYNREGGIRYEGLARDLKIVEPRGERKLQLTFNGSRDSETLSFMITIFPNNRVHTNVNSSQRDAISYEGEIEPLREEQE